MVLRRRKELIMWISNKIYQQVVVILFPSVRVRLCIIVLVLLCNVVMRNVGLPESRSEIEQGLLEKKNAKCVLMEIAHAWYLHLHCSCGVQVQWLPGVIFFFLPPHARARDDNFTCGNKPDG